MAKRDSNTSSLEDAIQRLLKVYKLGDKMVELDIIQAWPKVMGPMIAAKTDEVRVKNKILFVRLSSSTLREELSYGKTKMIQNLNDYVGHEFLKDAVLK